MGWGTRGRSVTRCGILLFTFFIMLTNFFGKAQTIRFVNKAPHVWIIIAHGYCRNKVVGVCRTKKINHIFDMSISKVTERQRGPMSTFGLFPYPGNGVNIDKSRRKPVKIMTSAEVW